MELNEFKEFLEEQIGLLKNTIDCIHEQDLGLEASNTVMYLTGNIKAYKAILFKLNSAEKKSGVKIIHG